ncbi:MAG: hypothetical protein K0S45_261 [Nitrospira sp.]|jgi:hypothetical protein|nr:hypothetical protein [Nitrospira sp.]
MRLTKGILPPRPLYKGWSWFSKDCKLLQEYNLSNQVAYWLENVHLRGFSPLLWKRCAGSFWYKTNPPEYPGETLSGISSRRSSGHGGLIQRVIFEMSPTMKGD